MSAIPPRQTPDTSAYATSETGGDLVAMYNAASHANAESFPVLKAFQDYLEAERSQARKRVMQFSIFFAVLVGVVVTGFIFAGIFMFRNMTTVQNKLLDVALAQKVTPSPAPAVQTSPALEESVKQMSRVTAELQTSLDKKLDGVSEISAKVHEKVASQDGELEKLRAELRQLQEQSTKLKNELVSIQEEGKKPAAATAPKVAPVALAAATPAPKPEPKILSPEPVAAPIKPVSDPRFPPAVKEPPVTPAGITPPPAPPGMMATAIPLKTKNIGTIPWRVLIPE
ncbi:MAG: hypothetical protein WCK89_20240 [bacterium]